MKILHVLPAFYPSRGGIETLVAELSIELKEKFDVDSIFMIPRFWKSPSQMQGEETFRVYSVDVSIHKELLYGGNLIPAREILGSIKRIDDVFRSEKPDLIHIHGVNTLFKLSSHMARKYKIPFVHHIHGELPTPGPEELLPILTESPCVIAVSPEVAANLATVLPNKDPLILRNGIRIKDLERIPSDKYRISLIGRLEPQKGFNFALKAISELKNNSERLEIHIVGIGDHLYLQALAEQLNISHLIYFHGRCSGDDTLEVIRSSDLVVVPSVDTEGFSLVAAEAGSLGIPVVATKVGGLSTTVVDGITGILVPPSDIAALRDAIDFYLENPEIARVHGEAAKLRMREEFGIEKYARLMNEMYLSEISRQRRELNAE
jgi:glycosyltransferase involved in cell wall biosynthesis